MPISATSPALRRARVALAIVTILTGSAFVFAGPTMGGVPAAVQESPTGSSSPTPSASSSPSPSSSTSPEPRGVSLTASDRMVTIGREVRLSGQVFSTDPACEGQQAVQLRRRFVGAPEFKLLETVHTDSGGGFETRLDPRRSAEYRATLFGSSGCETTASENVGVFVRVAVSISSSDNPIAQGNFFTVSGGVKPTHRGTQVVLERKRLQGWRKVDSARLNRESRYVFTLVAGWEGERSFRVRWPSQDFDHEPNKSRTLTLRSI